MRPRTVSLALPVLLVSVFAARALASSEVFTLNGPTTDGGTVTGSLTYDPSLAATGGTTGGSFTIDEPGTTGIPAGIYDVAFDYAGESDGGAIQSAVFYTPDYAFALDVNFAPNSKNPPILCVVGTCPIGNGQTASTSTFYANSGNFPGDPLGPGTFTSPTPEPGGLALLGTGLFGAAAVVRRRIPRS